MTLPWLILISPLQLNFMARLVVAFSNLMNMNFCSTTLALCMITMALMSLKLVVLLRSLVCNTLIGCLNCMDGMLGILLISKCHVTLFCNTLLLVCMGAGPKKGPKEHSMLSSKLGFCFCTLLGKLDYVYIVYCPDIGYTVVTL